MIALPTFVDALGMLMEFDTNAFDNGGGVDKC